MPATKVQLTGGQFQDAEGNVLNGGYLKMKLSQDGSVAGVGQVCAGIEIQINLDTNGAVIAGQFVWANSDISPANTYYRVTGYTAKGQIAWGPNNQQVASGSTFDVGTWVPNQVISWTPAVQSLRLQTNDVDNPNQALLNFDDSATVTWAVDGSGNLTATAGAGPSGPTQATVIGQRMYKCIPNSGALSGQATFGSQPTNGGQGQSPGATFLVSIHDTPAPDTCYVGIQTTAVNPSSSAWGLLDSISYFVPPAAGSVYTTANLAVVKWRVRVVDTVDVRLWLTMSDVYGTTQNAFSAALPVGLNLFGFRYDTSAGDTTWKAVTSDGAGGNTIVNTGVTPVINQSATFAIEVSTTSLKFYINGTLVATITTNIMASTVYLGDLFRVDNVGIANVKGFAINEVMLVDSV